VADRLDNKTRLALLDKFKTLAGERIERLNNGLVELEKDPQNEAAAAGVLREIHTLKGEAKLMGFADINLVAHRTEDLLMLAKQRQFRISPELADAILKGFDIIGYLLRKQIGGESVAVDLGAFLAEVDQLRGDKPAPPHPPSPAAAAPTSAPSPAPEPRRAAPPPIDLQGETSIRVDIKKLDRLSDLMADLMRYQLKRQHSLGELWSLGEQWRRGLQQLQTQIATTPQEDKLSAEDVAWTMVLLREHVAQLSALLVSFREVLLPARNELFEDADCLNALESTVREIRMLPLSSLFGRYPRAIRDLAREQGKSVNVVVHGGEIEMDKQVLDRIGEPLLHIFRNAVDHGLETPAERRAGGKPEEGTITLLARQAGSHIEIVVADDGRGISTQLIRQTAVRSQLMSRAEAEELTEEELLLLVFRPGFSTKAQATEVSGRGIGLEVVKDRVEGLGGSVQIESTPRRGTRILLEVPLSVALLRALVVACDPGSFAIPSHSLQTIVEVAPKELVPTGDGQAIRLEGALVPVFSLRALLGLSPSSPAAGEAAGRIVVMQSHGHRLALQIDRVVGERDLIHRPLDPFVGGLRLFIGAAVVEQSMPILILNVPELFRLSEHRPGRHLGSLAAERGQAERVVLLVEDSEMTRDMLAGIVTSMGCRILEAANGRDALERIRQQRPSLVITDLEMPIMDGFELIEQIRTALGLKDVPIVVLSSRGSAEDKKHAAELGADAYLVKAEFREENLVEMINRFTKGRLP
jgi:two-component system, chemotaxis family, sensor kinase CheA